MKPIFIGIAGGSGAGKSTLSIALMNKYPEKIGLIQLDDYFKPAEDAPKFAGFPNREVPEAFYFEKFVDDLYKLSQGQSVVLNTKNQRLNPDYKETYERISTRFFPKPILLVEGFLILHDERVRKLLSTSVFLDAEHDKRWARRVHSKNDEYEKRVLIPMHHKYVVPTQQRAEHVINVSELSKEQVLEKVEDIIEKFLP